MQQVRVGNEPRSCEKVMQNLGFTTTSADSVEQLSLKQKAEFEASSEGKQSDYLAALLLRIVSLEHFLAFASNKEGEGPLSVRDELVKMEQSSIIRSGIVEKIAITKLNSELQGLSQKVQSGELVSWQVWNYYRKLKGNLSDAVKRLQNITDHSMFVAQFMELVASATKYPQVPIAKTLSSKKTTPQQILALENHSLILAIWKLLMKRFWFKGPKDQEELWGLIQRYDEEKAMELIAKKLIEEKTAGRKLNKNKEAALKEKTIAELKRELSEYFKSEYSLSGIKGIDDPTRPEDKSNIFAFEEYLSVKENILLRLLSENGQAKEVNDFLNWFGRARERKRKETRRTYPDLSLRIFTQFVKPITREFSNIAGEAIREFSRQLIHSNIAIERRAIKERYKLIVTTQQRITQLTERYRENKILIQGIKQKEERRAIKLALSATALTDKLSEIQKLEQRRNKVLVQMNSALLIKDAEYELQKIEQNAVIHGRELDDEAIRQGLSQISNEAVQQLVDDPQALNNVKQAIAFMSEATLKKQLNERAEYTKKVVAAVLELTKELEKISESINKLYKEAEYIFTVIGQQSNIAAEESKDIMTSLGEHGLIPHERHDVN